MTKTKANQQRKDIGFKDMKRGEQVAYLMGEEGKKIKVNGKDVEGEGLNATEVSEVLGISRNAVYQQIRKNRSKGSGSTTRSTTRTAAKKTGGTSGRKSAGKSSGAKRTAAKPTPAPAPAAPAPTPEVSADATPEQVIEARLSAVTGEIEDVANEIKALTVRLDGDKDTPGLSAEKDRLTAALSALRGETPAPAAKAPAAKKSGGSGAKRSSGAKQASGNGNGAAAPAADTPPAEAPATPPADPAPAAPAAADTPPADDPFEGDGGIDDTGAQEQAEAPAQA